MPSDLKYRIATNSTTRTPSGKDSETIVDLATPCSASHEGSCFKENINISKSETPKLNVEPLQMKRKKKGGGYNLRKSLAWDRAFFTEEGVLDPLELSIISGASGRKELPVIDEGTPGSQLTIEPLDLQELNANPLKELPDEDLGNDRRDCLSPKPNSSSSNIVISTSLTAHKVSTHVGSKSGSRCGDCPPSLPSSSLKRPATVNAGKAAAKELKLPKVPGSKSGFSPVCATKSTILRANCVKHNQFAQPVLNIKKSAGLKIFSNSLKNAQNASKASSLQPACHSESGTSSLKRHSSVNICPLVGDDAYNSGSKMIAANMTSSRPVHSSDGQDQFTAFAASFSRIAHVSGRIMHLSQTQTMKPSGLRMPSPSLSFFSQPEVSVLNSLSLRDADTDICGSQKPGNLRLEGSLGKTPKMGNSIAESISNSSVAISSSSRCLMPSNTNAVQKVGIKVLYDALDSEPIGNKLVEDNKYVDGQNENLSKKKGAERIKTLEDTHFLKVEYEVPSESESCELATNDKNLKKAIHCCTGKSESCGSGWRNPELISDQNTGICRSEIENAIDKQWKEPNTCNFFISNHNANLGTQCEGVIDHREQKSLEMRSHWEDICKPDCHEPCTEQTDRLKYPPSETDKRSIKNGNALKTKERASDLVGVSQLYRAWCVEEANTEALEHRRANNRSSDIGFNNQDANLLKETASIDIMTDELLAGEARMQNAAFASTVADCKNNADLISEVGDDVKQSRKDLIVQNVCPRIELDSQKNDELQTRDRLLPEEQISLQKSQQEEIAETLPFAVQDGNNGNILTETKIESPQSPDGKHDCNYDKFKVIRQPLISIHSNSVDNYLSFDKRNNLIHKTFNHDGMHTGKANYYELDVPSKETMRSAVSVDGRWEDGNDLRIDEPEKVLLHDPANENLANNLYQDTQLMNIDYCSSFPKSWMHEVSQKNFHRKVTDTRPLVEEIHQNKWATSTLPIQKGGADVNNKSNTADSGLVQSPESNMLNECCIEHSEDLELLNVGSVDEKLSHGNVGLHFKTHLQNGRTGFDESNEDNALGCMFASVAGQNNIQIGSIKNSSVSAQELPLKPESCNDADETDCQSYFLDAITDPSRIESFFDPNMSEVFGETNSSFSELHPKLDHVKVNSALANNKYEDGRHVPVFRQNTIPFSDEWLAAVEAAGEDILTRKGGAVQNSPPGKSLPEPSPWSPVKKKNNQIGPFDCTKFSNHLS